MCVHTLTPRENRIRNILNNSEKNTIFNEHPVSSLITENAHVFNQLTDLTPFKGGEGGVLAVPRVKLTQISSQYGHSQHELKTKLCTCLFDRLEVTYQ